MEKPDMEPSLPGESLGFYSLQRSHHQQLQQGASRMTFMKPLQGKTFWNVTTGSSSGCRGCSPRAPQGSAARSRCGSRCSSRCGSRCGSRCSRGTLSSSRRAACPVLLSRVWVRIEHLSLSPAAKKKIYFGAMRGLQPSFWSATILFYTGVTVGSS